MKQCLYLFYLLLIVSIVGADSLKNMEKKETILNKFKTLANPNLQKEQSDFLH